jgi:hypothetical protein
MDRGVVHENVDSVGLAIEVDRDLASVGRLHVESADGQPVLRKGSCRTLALLSISARQDHRCASVEKLSADFEPEPAIRSGDEGGSSCKSTLHGFILEVSTFLKLVSSCAL